MRFYILEHPAALHPSRSPEHRDIFHTDFRRIVQLLHGWRPSYVDTFQTITQPDVLRRWLGTGLSRVALDLETDRAGRVDMVGLARSAEEAVLFAVPDPALLSTLADALRGREVIVHYGEGLEMPWLLNLYRCGPQDELPLLVHDLHKLFHAYDPEYASAGGADEARHGGSGALAFIQSLFSWRPYHKHLLKQCYHKHALINWPLKARYCMLDCVVTWECFHRIEEQMRTECPATLEAYQRDAIPLLHLMVRSTHTGWKIDREAFTQRAEALQREVHAAAQAVEMQYGPSIRPQGKKAKTPVSLHAIKKLLLTQGIKLPRTTKGGPSLDKKARQRLFAKHPELAALDRYLGLQDTLSDCYNLKMIHKDGRIHPIWSGFEKSWRWRCTDPNVTQRPPAERHVLVADQGA